MKINGIKLKDAGKKIPKPNGEVQPVAIQDNGPSIRYPSLSSYDGEIPGMENMDVQKEYIMIAKVRCTSKSTREEKGNTMVNGGFDILACGFKQIKDDGDMTESELNVAMNESVEEIENE